MINLPAVVGTRTVSFIRETGLMFDFLFRILRGILSSPFRWRQFITQIHFMGVKSWLIIVLSAFTTGMVLTLQGYYTLRQFGSEGMLGSGVALTLIREMGPVLAALMLTGRGGSAMTAELGIMRITEQIDALTAMNLEPVKFLAAPRFLATVFVTPILVAFFVTVGIMGAYVVGVWLVGVNPGIFVSGMVESVTDHDLISCLIKALVFGVVIGHISTYKGFYTFGGAEGVGRSTTSAVVMGSVLILAWDYILTSFLF